MIAIIADTLVSYLGYNRSMFACAFRSQCLFASPPGAAALSLFRPLSVATRRQYVIVAQEYIELLSLHFS